MRFRSSVPQSQISVARSLWGELPPTAMDSLANLVRRFGISVLLGDVQYIDGRWYITHSGLLRIAHRRGCSGLRTSLLTKFCDSANSRWVFRATVYKSRRSKGFVGYGDADPSNTSPLVRGAEMRVAETRAVNRSLRKAYGIGLCSVEELGSFSAPPMPVTPGPRSNGHAGANGSSNGQPRLRDQLRLLIRQHDLDPRLVKAYAADFCGTSTLKEASRDLIESFINQLAATAKKDRDALVCKLNSYDRSTEATL
jgi:hypothetical protein